MRNRAPSKSQSGARRGLAFPFAVLPRLSRQAFRAATTALVLAAWLVLSNHCALASLLENPHLAAQTGHRCCQADRSASDAAGSHASSQPRGDSPAGPDIPCCKSLQVSTPDGVKLAPVSSSVFAILPPWMHGAVLDGPLPDFEAPAPEAGPPPRAVTFAEAVLQNALRAHAPPERA